MNSLVNVLSQDSNQEPTITSMEVAEAMGVRHKNLLEKIDELSAKLLAAEISAAAQTAYWCISSFEYEPVPGQKRSARCYNITKLGCEFIAHKSTGQKGVEFTHWYMQKFEQMKAQLTIPSYQIEDPIARAERWIEEQKARLALEQQVSDISLEKAQVESELQVAQPKLEYHDKVLMDPTYSISITAIASDLGISNPSKVNTILKFNHIIKDYNGSYISARYITGRPYCKSYNYIATNGTVKPSIKWSQLGKKFILTNWQTLEQAYNDNKPVTSSKLTYF